MKVFKKNPIKSNSRISHSCPPSKEVNSNRQSGQTKGNIMTAPMKQLCSFSYKGTRISWINLICHIKNSHLMGILGWELKENVVQYLYWDLHLFTLRPGLDFSTYKTSAKRWSSVLSYWSSKAWFARKKLYIAFSAFVWFLPTQENVLAITRKKKIQRIKIAL